MAQLESQFEDHEEHIFQCDGGDDHFLRISWDHEDSSWRFLWITAENRPTGIRSRLKTIRDAVRGRVVHNEIILDEKTVDRILEALHNFKAR